MEIIIVLVVVFLGLYVMGTYNSLVSLKNKAKDQWSQIEVQLKRRYDLIPNLVETVKGYAKHEKDTLESVVNARNKAISAPNATSEMEANGEITNALNKLLALTESYPELKANENFTKLQDDLKDTEDKIAYSRQFYNDSVLSLNNKIEMFPSNIVAKMFKFVKLEFFKTSEKEQINPQVKF